MAEIPTTSSPDKGAAISLDTWAVVIALLLALAVKFNLFGKVPW
jgi:hypothetical protein